MKPETRQFYSRAFCIFLPNFIKIHPYNFELYSFKVCALFFETQCMMKLDTCSFPFSTFHSYKFMLYLVCKSCVWHIVKIQQTFR